MSIADVNVAVGDVVGDGNDAKYADNGNDVNAANDSVRNNTPIGISGLYDNRFGINGLHDNRTNRLDINGLYTNRTNRLDINGLYANHTNHQ